MKKLLLSFTLLASTLGTSALALADNQPARDRVVDHRDARPDRDERTRRPTWSQLAQSKLAANKGNVVFKMNRAASDDDRLRLAISGGSARIKTVTIAYVGGRSTVLKLGEQMSGSDILDLALPARHGDIKSVTVTYAKARGRGVAIQLQGIDLPVRNGGHR